MIHQTNLGQTTEMRGILEYILDFLEGLNKYIEHNSISVDTVRFDLQ